MSKEFKAATPSSARTRSNATTYRSSKGKQDHILLRLDKGDGARFDSACSAVGLRRNAFTKLYLMPLIDALAERLPDIAKARAAQNVSLGTLMARALEQAIAAAENASPPPAGITDEFDALFGPADGDG